MHGLHHQLAEMKRQAEAKRLIADDPESAAFIGYSAHEDSLQLARDMIPLGIAIDENLSLILHLEEALQGLADSPHNSRHRSLVITLLEQAQDRLRRELGDKPGSVDG